MTAHGRWRVRRSCERHVVSGLSKHGKRQKGCRESKSGISDENDSDRLLSSGTSAETRGLSSLPGKKAEVCHAGITCLRSGRPTHRVTAVSYKPGAGKSQLRAVAKLKRPEADGQCSRRLR